MTGQETISLGRFLQRLDDCFNRNDREGAGECIRFWEGEARHLNDSRGLLAVLNEAIGYYRRTMEKGPALEAVEECLLILNKLGQSCSLSGAAVYINAATTLAVFDRGEEALVLYGKAADCYEAEQKTISYEYAALLNNRAGTRCSLKKFDEAEKDWHAAIQILEKLGGHDAEIALTLILLAHLTYDRDETAFDKVETLLNEAWERLNADTQPRDGRYADILLKCVPSLEYFKRADEAQACREVAEEIYTGRTEQGTGV